MIRRKLLSRGAVGVVVFQLFAVLFCNPSTAQQPNDRVSKDSPIGFSEGELEKYIEMLGAPSYQKRELASRKLVDAGIEAIAPLEAAMRGGNLELINRASTILQDLALMETPEDHGIAWKALERLQQNGPGSASTRAYSSLTLIRRERIKRAQAKLAAAGIQAGLQNYRLGNDDFVKDIVRISDQWDGNSEVFEWFPWLYSTEVALLEGSAVNEKTLNAVASLPEVKEVRLHNGKLNADELRQLKALKRFDLLELHFVEVGNGDDDLFALAELPVRQKMIITGTDFDFEDFEALEVNRDDLTITFSKGGFLGVQCSAGLPTCIVNSVVPGSSAYKAGVLGGDIITQLGEYEVERFEDLQTAVRRFETGEKIDLKIMRGELEMTLQVELGRLE